MWFRHIFYHHFSLFAPWIGIKSRSRSRKSRNHWYSYSICFSVFNIEIVFGQWSSGASSWWFSKDRSGYSHQRIWIVLELGNAPIANWQNPNDNCNTHRIHVWYIYLHLVDIYGKCRYRYHTWILWDMNNVTLAWSIRRCLDGPKNLWTLVGYHLVRKRRQFHLKTLDVFWCFFVKRPTGPFWCWSYKNELDGWETMYVYNYFTHHIRTKNQTSCRFFRSLKIGDGDINLDHGIYIPSVENTPFHGLFGDYLWQNQGGSSCWKSPEYLGCFFEWCPKMKGETGISPSKSVFQKMIWEYKTWLSNGMENWLKLETGRLGDNARFI